MTIIASCCHEVNAFNDLKHVSIKGYDRDFTRCVRYMSICAACLRLHQTEGAVLYNKEQENAWLFGSD